MARAMLKEGVKRPDMARRLGKTLGVVDAIRRAIENQAIPAGEAVIRHIDGRKVTVLPPGYARGVGPGQCTARPRGKRGATDC